MWVVVFKNPSNISYVDSTLLFEPIKRLPLNVLSRQ